MSAPNSGMTIHSLVLTSDSFSCNCNSIQSPVSIVHLRVILTYLIPLLRVYINYSISNAYSVSQLVQQCDYIYQNKYSSMYIRTSSFVSLETPLRVSSIRIYILIDGFVDPKCNSYNINYNNM